MEQALARKLTVILHADFAGSIALVQRDESPARFHSHRNRYARSVCLAKTHEFLNREFDFTNVGSVLQTVS